MFLLISGGHIGEQFLSVFLRGSSRVPPPRTGSCDEPLRTSTWEATNYGVSIQSSIKVREMFRQITQKLWATKT